MKALLRKNHDGLLYDHHMHIAYEGFKQLGDVDFCTTVHALRAVDPATVIVGSEQDLHDLLAGWDIECPNLDYPEELRPFLGRKIWPSTLFTITNDPSLWRVFIKPRKETKRFIGTVLEETSDLVKLGGFVSDIDVWCSEKVEFVSEWRVYVCDGVPLGMFWYKGKWDITPDVEVIQRAIAAYHSAPRGYAIDFGVDSEGRTLLVEVNDGFGLGNYGLPPVPYAQLLAARWQELTADLAKEYQKETKAQDSDTASAAEQ